jgi:decaprenyl-phosphate phosphoribosyltransferase
MASNFRENEGMQKLKTYLNLLRPHQYLKNGFVWLPVFFGYRIFDAAALGRTLIAFTAFCLMASTIYVINDFRDREEDRRHPVKKHRPLASGAVSPGKALCVGLICFGASLSLALALLPTACLYLLLAYLLLNIAYSQRLKHVPIVDIVCIALGFVLRIFVGGAATGVPISPWIVIMTFLLALFLALAKRRDDLLLMDQEGPIRKAIDGYNHAFISLAMSIMASVIIVAYILDTVSPEVVARHGTHRLYITSFWVLLGLLRYLQITFVEEKSGSPTLVLIKDYVLQAIIGLWLVNIFILLYVIKGYP